MPITPAVACSCSPQGAYAAGWNCTLAEGAANKLNGARSDVHVDVLVSLALVFDAVLPDPSAQRSLSHLVQKRLLRYISSKKLPPTTACNCVCQNLLHTQRGGLYCLIIYKVEGKRNVALLGWGAIKEIMLKFLSKEILSASKTITPSTDADLSLSSMFPLI